MMEIIGIAVVAIFVIVVVIAVLFEKGVIGLSQDRIDKIHAKGDELQAKLEAKLAKKVKGVLLKGPTKAQRLDENAELLAAGKITQAEHDAARAAILTT